MIFLKRRWILLNIVGIIGTLSYLLCIWNVFSTIFDEESNNEKIDWNDYNLLREDSLRTGFGEHGKAETLTDPDEIRENNKLFELFGMSVVVSDKVSVNRSIPDYRHFDCLKKKYLRKLPRVSIIIIFNNEIFSVFKRTLHSLYNRTPHELIEEVILVNDNSTIPEMYGPLKKYIEENFPALNFKIINMEKRVGLMMARVAGAKAAKSDYVFLTEPHCEMTYNWLPPLIEPLLADKRIATVPIIDNVFYENLEYYENEKGNKGCRGAFDWELEYQKLPRFPTSSGKELDPFETPVMTGGVFMIRKDYFFEIGPYDEELLIWGAENIEMSLKINLCGGKLLEVPCSRIGHYFRAFTKSRKHESGVDFLTFNQKRIVEVWFDEYKDFVYRRDPERFEIDEGDLEKPKKFREKLNCKPMKYFFEVIAPDLIEKFPADTPPFASGQIMLKNSQLCLQAPPQEQKESFSLKRCQEQMAQSFELSWYKDIRVKSVKLCMDLYKITLSACHQEGGNQLFKYDLQTQQIINRNSCLEAHIETGELKFTDCDGQIETQKWTWSETTNQTMLNDWENAGELYF